MPDGYVATPEQAAERAVAGLEEMGVDLPGVAIVDAEGRVLASTTDAEWSARSKELWAGVQGDGAATPNQIHVATDAGEVFALRAESGFSAIAVSARFALESLMFCDLRALLRRLDAELATAG